MPDDTDRPLPAGATPAPTAATANRAATPSVNRAATPAANRAATPSVNRAATPGVNRAALPSKRAAPLATRPRAVTVLVGLFAFAFVLHSLVLLALSAPAPAGSPPVSLVDVLLVLLLVIGYGVLIEALWRGRSYLTWVNYGLLGLQAISSLMAVIGGNPPSGGAMVVLHGVAAWVFTRPNVRRYLESRRPAPEK